MADRQSTAGLSVITSVTGLPIPELMGDFSHLMPDAFSKGSINRFHDSLRDLSLVIRDKNKKRDIGLTAFQPEEVTLSVAI